MLRIQIITIVASILFVLYISRLIVKGKLRVKIGDEPEQICGPGTLLYFPANVVHSTAAMPDEDVVFFAVKDRSQGMFDNKRVDEK